MKSFLSAPTNFLNRNTGYLILVAIIVFGIAIVHQQRDNQQLLNNSNTAIKQLKKVSEQNKKLSEQIVASQVKEQTHIDCIITFFGLSPTERQSRSISDVCHFVPNPTGASQPSQSSSVPAASPSPSQSNVSSSAPAQNTPNANSGQSNPSQPTFLDSLPVAGGVFKRLGL